MKFFLFGIFLFSLVLPALAEDTGPFAPPCPGCPEFDIRPYPHTGLWIDPERPGTGINVDVQDGLMAAFYYGYRDDGSPIWYVFSGHLQKSDAEDAYWELEADLIEASNGEPVDGDYQAPDLEVAGAIRVDIMQRHLLRFSIDGGPYRRMVPQVFGSHVVQPFAPAADVHLPDFKGLENRFEVDDGMSYAPWITVHYAPRGISPLFPEGFSRFGYAFAYWRVHWGAVSINPHSGHYNIQFYEITSPGHWQQSGEIDCGPADEIAGANSHPGVVGDDPVCHAFVHPSIPDDELRIYYMPLGDLGDRRFTAVSEDGWVMEGIRLRYD
jgi:hypothetical protein